MANREIEAILKVSSKLGSMSALKTLTRELDRVNGKAKAFNRAQSIYARSTSNMLAATMRYMAPAAIAYGLQRSVVGFAAVERRLNRIALNAGKGRDAADGMLKTINQASRDYAMSQDDVTSGLETLVAAGRSAEDAMGFLPAVVATAQAAGAEVTDIATTADAVGSSFDIAGDRMQKAFDILVTAGKQGKFELRDMAQYLPSMAPAFAALGYKGEKGLAKLAAMLQTIRQRTGSASEAATAAQNIFQKMESDQTVKKFSTFGIDLRKELARARKEGRDLVDTFLDLSEKATKGDLSKIPQLFTDAQFQVGMRALMQGRKDMEGFQHALANVDGSTLKDLGQILGDNQSKIDRMASSWSKFSTSFGNALSDPASAVLDKVSENLDYGESLRGTLKKRGMGYWERENWILKNSFPFDDKEKNLAAFEGGWRSPEGRLAEKGSMALSPELPSRRIAAERGTSPIQVVPVGGKKRRKGLVAQVLPDTIDVPQSRPDPNMVLPELRYNRFPAPSPAGMRRLIAAEAASGSNAPVAPSRSIGPSFRETEVASMASYRKDYSQISDAIEDASARGAQEFGPPLIDAAGPAGEALGSIAATAFSMQADSIGARIGAAIGAAIAPYIASAKADLMRPIGSLGSNGGASGNPGRTAPNAGVAGASR